MIKKLLILAGIAVAICFVIGSIDAPPPDVSAFARTTEEPADEDNAYCGFVAATNAVRRMPGAVQWEKLSPEETDAIVDENAEALALFQNAMRRAKWYDKAARNAGGLYLPPMSDFAKMMKLYKAKVSRQIVRGEIASAVEGVQDFLLLNRTMQGDAESFVCWLLADGLRGMGMHLAVQIVVSGKASDAELRKLLETLLLTDSSMLRKSILLAVDNDFVYYFENAQRIVDSSMRCTGLRRIKAGFEYHPNRTRALYVKMIGKVKELLSNDYDKGALQSFEDEIKSETPGRFGCLAPNFVGWQLLAALFPAWKDLAERLACSEFYLSASEVVVAAELYRRKTGRRPESLDALVPEFLPSVPTDPFDHGAALKYDVERDIVWTVGPDRDFTGDIQSGKKSYGRNRKYVVNLDGSEVK